MNQRSVWHHKYQQLVFVSALMKYRKLGGEERFRSLDFLGRSIATGSLFTPVLGIITKSQFLLDWQYSNGIMKRK